MSAITVEHLGKKVPDAGGWLTILDDIGFTVEAGESVAIVGASGSGKSTLLGLMAGLDLPTSGRIIASGQDIFAQAQIGVALDQTQLTPIHRPQKRPHLTYRRRIRRSLGPVGERKDQRHPIFTETGKHTLELLRSRIGKEDHRDDSAHPSSSTCGRLPIPCHGWRVWRG
jgi:ABC-type oligopeptide transport system ATPase subunit